LLSGHPETRFRDPFLPGTGASALRFTLVILTAPGRHLHRRMIASRSFAPLSRIFLVRNRKGTSASRMSRRDLRFEAFQHRESTRPVFYEAWRERKRCLSICQCLALTPFDYHFNRFCCPSADDQGFRNRVSAQQAAITNSLCRARFFGAYFAKPWLTTLINRLDYNTNQLSLLRGATFPSRPDDDLNPSHWCRGPVTAALRSAEEV